MTISPLPELVSLLTTIPIVPSLVHRLAHPPSASSGPDSTVELLKLTFNLLLHLPRLSEEAIAMDDAGRYLSGLSGEGSDVNDKRGEIGEWWDERLDAYVFAALIVDERLGSLSFTD